MRSYTLPALPSWQTVHYGILLVQIPIRDVPETSHQHLARSRAQRRASSSPTTRLVARILQHEPFAKWNHRSISLPRGPRWKPMALLWDKAKCFCPRPRGTKSHRFRPHETALAYFLRLESEGMLVALSVCFRPNGVPPGAHGVVYLQRPSHCVRVGENPRNRHGSNRMRGLSTISAALFCFPN